MNPRALLSFAAACLAVALFAESASAQDVRVRYHHWDDYGFSGRAYSSGRVPTPPYFAIHPPVYYSYPVPRTYGYSPFAYPSYVMTPEIKEPAKPAMFENPHVKQPATEAKTKSASRSIETKTALPEVMENPYARERSA